MFRKLNFRKNASRTGCKANPRDFISTGDIPLGCRELTDEEAFKVNGGSKEETGEKKDSTKNTVTVSQNDTLGKVVSDYNNEHGTNFTVGQIAELNGISNPDVIHPGQEISFSFNTPQSAPTTGPTSTPTPSISMTQESPASGVTPSKPVAATASSSMGSVSVGSVNENPGTTVAKRTSVSGAGNSSEKSLISFQQESTLGSDSVNATVSSQTDYGTEWFSKAYNAHVEDYKRAAIRSGLQGRNTEGKKVEGTQPEGNLTDKGYPGSTDGFNRNQVNSGTPGSLAREGFPSTTDGYPEAYDYKQNEEKTFKQNEKKLYKQRELEIKYGYPYSAPEYGSLCLATSVINLYAEKYSISPESVDKVMSESKGKYIAEDGTVLDMTGFSKRLADECNSDRYFDYVYYNPETKSYGNTPKELNKDEFQESSYKYAIGGFYHEGKSAPSTFSSVAHYETILNSPYSEINPGVGQYELYKVRPVISCKK